MVSSNNVKVQHPAAARSTSSRWPSVVLLVGLLVALCSYLNTINARFYLMDPEGLNSIVQSSLATAAQSPGSSSETNTTLIISNIIEGLAERYPNVAISKDFKDKSNWVFNNAGGAMGSMFIIHASITEYLIVFGSAVGTEGHSGRHTADDYFHILTGRQTAYEAGNLVREVYNPGDVHHMRRGVVKQYTMIPETWALEYAQGWIPLMLPFGYADGLFSTIDYITLYRTTWLTGKEMIRNLLRGKI